MCYVRTSLNACEDEIRVFVCNQSNIQIYIYTVVGMHGYYRTHCVVICTVRVSQEATSTNKRRFVSFGSSSGDSKKPRTQRSYPVNETLAIIRTLSNVLFQCSKMVDSPRNCNTPRPISFLKCLQTLNRIEIQCSYSQTTILPD